MNELKGGRHSKEKTKILETKEIGKKWSLKSS
jgi:hypothetical protein